MRFQLQCRWLQYILFALQSQLPVKSCVDVCHWITICFVVAYCNPNRTKPKMTVRKGGSEYVVYRIARDVDAVYPRPSTLRIPLTSVQRCRDRWNDRMALKRWLLQFRNTNTNSLSIKLYIQILCVSEQCPMVFAVYVPYRAFCIWFHNITFLIRFLRFALGSCTYCSGDMWCGGVERTYGQQLNMTNLLLQIIDFRRRCL